MALVKQLDEGGAWAELQSRDVPVVILDYVASRLSTDDLLKIRKDLGILSGNDVRWKKIMQAMKSSTRTDSTAIFLKMMARNEEIASDLHEMTKDMLANARPLSKLVFSAAQTMASLQRDIVSMGRDLGVFQDQSQGQGGGGGVTIVVQSNIPHPSKETITIHQDNARKKNADMLERYRPPVDVIESE